jgi:hypothetical protein
MALQPRRLFIDVQNRTFLSSPISSLPSAAPAWVDEDVESVEIYALRPTIDPNQPYAFVDLSGATVKFAVGSTTPAALQTAWTAIPTTVTVTNSEVQEGGTFGGTIDEIQKLTWSGATPAQGTYTLVFPYRDITATINGTAIYSASNHGLYDGRQVTVGSQDFTVINSGQNSFSLAPIGSTTAVVAGSGTATISVPTITTPPIAYNATTAQVQQAVVSAGFVVNGIPQVVVSGENGKELTLQFSGRSGRRSYSPTLVSVLPNSGNTLAGAPGVTANVSYNTQEIAALIAAGTTSVTMEVEISEGAVRQTFRQPATLSADLISSTSPSPLPANVSTTFSLQSANGSVFTITVTNDGELSIAAIP